MRLLLLISCFFLGAYSANSQVNFNQAYTENALVPQGILEGVAWTNTHMVHLQNQQESCSGLPQAYGIMGLHDDGKGYFIENGAKVSELSGISITAQKSDPNLQILAYARAFNQIMTGKGATSSDDPVFIRETLNELSEIPDSGAINFLARDLQAHAILSFMRSSAEGIRFGFTPHHFNLDEVFGISNNSILSGTQIAISETGILGETGMSYASNEAKSLEYGPAIWNPAPPCNISLRNGVAVSAITIHTIQGSYAGAISWSQNCTSSVSYHYVIRSSDGQVTQMVNEADKAWHVGSENPYTIGYEHEGFVNDPSWYTEAMYNSSADLSRDIINSGYGIPAVRTYYGASSAGTQLLGGCTKIKGHQHYPNQTHTDPGINWDWEKYYRLINNNPVINTITSTSGGFFDTGGIGGNYQDDEREMWLFQPPNTLSITMNFTDFDLESGYDNLFIYDGDSIGAPLIGTYTGTTSPGQITSSGGSLLVEFRSDCGTTAPGWQANYSTILSDTTKPITTILPDVNWKTDDFDVMFSDSDTESGIAEHYYNVSQKPFPSNAPGTDGTFGFIRDEFEGQGAGWNSITGNFLNFLQAYNQSDTLEQNSNSSAALDQNNTHSYLYEWTQVMHPSTGNERAGMHFFCSDSLLPNRGNSYFVYLRGTDKVQIYSVDNDVFNLEDDTDYTIDMPEYYTVQVTYNPNTGWIKVYMDGQYVSSWQDPTPLQSGNSISLRSGGCSVFFDDVRVYRSRGTQESITVGVNGMFNAQSEYAIESGYVRSIVIDSTNNISSTDEFAFLVDYSVPELIALNDGLATDIDTFYTTTLDANWSMEDIHSGIDTYEVAVGTLPSLDNIVPWTSNGLLESFSTVLSPSPNYNEVFHVSIRAINGAGMEDVFVSDGQLYNGDLELLEQFLQSIVIYPNPTTDLIQFSNATSPLEVIIYDSYGKVCIAQTLDPAKAIDVSSLNQGVYNVVLSLNQSIIVKKLVIH